MRFGYRFLVTDDGYGLWNHFAGSNSGVTSSTFENPNLQVGQTYTFSTHVYVPSVNPITGVPQNENTSLPYGIKINQIQTCHMDNDTWVSDWTNNLRDDDGTYNNSQGLDVTNVGTNEDPNWTTEEYSFSNPKYDCYSHCHPIDAPLGEYYHGSEDPNEYPMTDKLLNDLTCWSALTPDQCDGDCYWHNPVEGGMLEGYTSTLFESPYFYLAGEEPAENSLQYDTWNRISVTFTPQPNTVGDLLNLRFQTNIGDATWGTCYCQTDYYGNPAECLVDVNSDEVLWDVSSNFLVENIYDDNETNVQGEVDFTYADEVMNDGIVEYYWTGTGSEEYVRILVRNEATYNHRHRLLYSNAFNSFSNNLETLIDPAIITPDTKFRLTGKIRGCQVDVTSEECSDHEVTSTQLFGLRGFSNHSFRGDSSSREITLGGTEGLDEWIDIDSEFQVGKFVPCVCAYDNQYDNETYWENIDDPHNEDNCGGGNGTIINLDICNENVFCKGNLSCNNHDSTACRPDTEYGLALAGGETGGCIITPYLTFPEVGTLSNEYQELHESTTFEPANDASVGADWRNEIHVKDLELRYVPVDIDAMSCEDFGGFWTGTKYGEESYWKDYDNNCTIEGGIQCTEIGATGVWDSLLDINDSIYIWGAQLEIGDTMSSYTVEDLEFTDCLEVESAIPNHQRHWKNIASTFDNILNEDNYYPVLPVFDQKGEFIQTQLQTDSNGNTKIPFGGIQYDGIMWNPSDSESPITNDIEDNSLKIEIKTKDVENNILMDESGNKNFGFTINDYNINFDLESREPSKMKSTRRFKKSRNNGAF